MSGPLALAAVSDLLRQMLDNGLKITMPSFVSSYAVTTMPLDLVSSEQNGNPSWLNLFLYQVTPNSGWRNEAFPSRDAVGQRVSNPPLALDLHYLLTASSKDPLGAEILLGCGMQVFHEIPFLSREYIADKLPPDSTEARNKALADAGLGDQIEQIKITPQSVTTEDLSRLWSAFGAKYRPSAAYLVSVVLIESVQPAKTPLPVLKIGREKPGVTVQPNLAQPIPTYPTIEHIGLPKRQISALLGDSLVIKGHHLTGDPEAEADVKQVVVRLESAQRGMSLSFQVMPTDYSDTAVGIKLDPTKELKTIFVGVYTLSVAITVNRPYERELTTNALPLVIAPRIEVTNAQPQDELPQFINLVRANRQDSFGDISLEVRCTPPVPPEQRVVLILGEREILPFPEQRSDVTSDLTFKATKVSPGTYWLRLRVDGIESLLIDRSDAKEPKFDITQQVEIK